MNTRWLRAAAYVTASGLLTGLLGAAAMGCEDPVDVTPGSSGGGDQAAVGTTQTTSAQLPANSAATDTTNDSANGNGNGNANANAQGQTQSPAQAQTTQQQPTQASAQPQAQQNPQTQQPQQAQAQSQSNAPPVDSSGYGTLPMPNAETQVGSYGTGTTVYPGGTGSYVTDVPNVPSQRSNGNGTGVVNGSIAPNAYSSSATGAVTNSTPSNTAVAVGAPGTANDLAPASPRSSQNVYNNTATTAPATGQLRTAATVATPVQGPRSSR